MAWPPPNANSARPQGPPPPIPTVATSSGLGARTETSPTANLVSEVQFNPNDAGNPYFIHSNESPAVVLGTPVLDGSNYYPWVRAMRIALLTKNKLAFINGKITVPDKTESRYETWERCNNLVVSWIVRSTAPEIGQTVLWKESAIDVWKDLEERFSEGDIFRISQVQGEIYQTFAMLHGSHMTKFTPMARKCIFIGYPNGVKGYKLYDLKTREVFISRDVEFYESVFPFSLVENVHDRVPTLVLPTHLATSLEEGNSLVEPSQNDDLMNIDAPSEQIESAEPQTSSQQSLRKSGRERTKPSYLQDYVCAVDVPKSKKTSPHVLSNVLSYDRLSSTFKAFAMNIQTAAATGLDLRNSQRHRSLHLRRSPWSPELSLSHHHRLSLQSTTTAEGLLLCCRRPPLSQDEARHSLFPISISEPH
nr:uncharacterized protein LOC109178841 [Ipomoea batatas]